MMSLPRDLKSTIPGPRRRQAQRGLLARRPDADAADDPHARRHHDQPRRQRELLGLPRGRRPRSAASTPTSTARYYHSNAGLPGGGGGYAEIDVPRRLSEALRPAGARLRPLPPPRLGHRARRAPAVVPAPGQGPDRRQRRLRPTARSCCTSSPATRATDIRSSHASLSLLKLGAVLAGKPVAEVPFPALDTPSGGTPRDRRRTRCTRPSSGSSRRKATKRATKATAAHAPRDAPEAAAQPGPTSAASLTAPGLMVDRIAGDDEAARLQVQLPSLPVYAPALLAAGGRYRDGQRRAYTIPTAAAHRHRAYRIVASERVDRAVLRRRGHDLDVAAALSTTPRRRTVTAGACELFRDGAPPADGRLAHAAGRLLGVQHPERALTNRQMLGDRRDP